jgi:hypothetical protein
MLIATGGDASASELTPLRKGFADAFPDVFATENVSTLKQALFLTNNPAIDALLKSSGNKTLAAIAPLDNTAKVRELFTRAFGREPDSDELAHSVAYLSSHLDLQEAARQLFWALLTSAEFRINH